MEEAEETEEARQAMSVIRPSSSSVQTTTVISVLKE